MLRIVMAALGTAAMLALGGAAQAQAADPAPDQATAPAPNVERIIRSQYDLQTYLDAFNARDYATQIQYYAPDVAFDVGALQIRSPEDIAAFYDDFHDYVDEHVEIARFAKTGDTVAVVVPTRFEARETYDKNGLLFEAGTVRETVSLIFYDLKDGKIRRVRMARYDGPASDFE